MKFKKQESLLNVLLGPGLYLLDNLLERLQDDMNSTKAESGTRMTPRPTASVVPATFFAAKKIRKYLGKPVLCWSEWASA